MGHKLKAAAFEQKQQQLKMDTAEGWVDVDMIIFRKINK